MRRTPLAIVALLALSTAAQADTKSWTALKGKFPADTEFVVSVDLAPLAKTATLGKIVDAVFANEPDAKQAVELLKTTCGIDVVAAITDVTVFGRTSGHDEVAIALGLAGVDKAGALACAQKLVDAGGKTAKITAKVKGKVTDYGATGQAGHLYAAWIAKDVVVISDDPTEKGKLEKLLAGKAPKGDLKTHLGKVVKTGVAFAALAITETDKDLGGTTKGGYGDLALSAGTVTATGHMVMSADSEATGLVANAQTELKKAQPEVAKQLPELGKLMGAIKMAAAGPEATFSVSVAESTLANLVPQIISTL